MRIRILFPLSGLIVGLGLLLVGPATALTFSVLHNFTGGSNGANPYAGLILAGNTLYGTTAGAFGVGGSGHGSVFAIHTDGTGFTNLHGFDGSDGDSPQAALVLSGNTLYGTAEEGGIWFRGTIFAVNTDATGFTNLHNFTPNFGVYPYAGVILSGNFLYGTTSGGLRCGKWHGV